MTTVVDNFDNFIEYIVSAFEAEMHNVERNNIWGRLPMEPLTRRMRLIFVAGGQARSMSNSGTPCALLCGECWGQRNSKQK